VAPVVTTSSTSTTADPGGGSPAARTLSRPSHELHGERALAQRAQRTLAHHRERLGEQLVERFAVDVAFAELVRFRRQLPVRQGLDVGLEGVDVLGDAGQPLHQLRLTGAEETVQQRHGSTPFTIAGRSQRGRRSRTAGPRIAKRRARPHNAEGTADVPPGNADRPAGVRPYRLSRMTP